MLSEIWLMRGGLPGVCPAVRHGLTVGMCGTRLLTQYGSREGVSAEVPVRGMPGKSQRWHLTSPPYGSVTSQ